MRIAYVTTYDARDVRQWSGTGFYAAQALSNAGANVDFIGPLQDPQRDPLTVRVRQRLYNKLLRNRLGIYTPVWEPSLLRHYAAEVQLRLPTTPVDVVFSPGTIPIAYLKTDAPIVFWSDATFASVLDFYPGYSGLHPRTIRAGHAYESAALKNAALAVYSSEWAAQSAVRDYGAEPARVKVVPYGANIACERTLEDVVTIADARSTSVCRLLFIGQDWVRKGGPKAIRIAADLRARGIDSELTVVGCTPPNAASLPEFVRVLGFVDKGSAGGYQLLSQLFSESHFFLLPTIADCTPIVFGEANSFGVPVITTDVGGIATVIRKGANGLMFPLKASAEDYGASIAELFADRDRYAALVRTSFAEYRDRLNWRVAGRTVMGHIRSLLDIDDDVVDSCYLSAPNRGASAIPEDV